MDFWEWQARQEELRRDRMLGRVQPSQVETQHPALMVKPLDEDGFEVKPTSWTDSIIQRFRFSDTQSKEQKR